MKDEIQVKLDEVIEKELQNLPALSQEEKPTAVANLNQLYKLRIEEAKIEQESVTGAQEAILKRDELKSRAKDRWVNVGVQVGLAVAGWIAYDIWNRRGLKI